MPIINLYRLQSCSAHETETEIFLEYLMILNHYLQKGAYFT
jgi:hypothetical protein